MQDVWNDKEDEFPLPDFLFALQKLHGVEERREDS